MEIIRTDKAKRIRRNGLLAGYHCFSAFILLRMSANGAFTGGPCNLGSGLLLFLLAGLIIFILCLVGIHLTSRNPANKYFLIINIGALAIWISIFFLA